MILVTRPYRKDIRFDLTSSTACRKESGGRTKPGALTNLICTNVDQTSTRPGSECREVVAPAQPVVKARIQSWSEATADAEPNWALTVGAGRQ